MACTWHVKLQLTVADQHVKLQALQLIHVMEISFVDSFVIVYSYFREQLEQVLQL